MAAEEADAESVDGEQEGEDAESERETSGPVGEAEEVHGTGGHPEQEGRLVEEADAVDEGCDEVAAVEHLAGDLDVDGVNVVEQARGEEAADLKDEPGEEDEGEEAGAPAAGWVLSVGLWRGSGRPQETLLGWYGEGFYGLGEAVVHAISVHGRGGLGGGVI